MAGEKKVINCPICSVVNDDSARFCAECGQRLQSDPAPVATEMPKEPEVRPPVATQTPLTAPEIVPTQPPMSQEAISAIEEAKKAAPPKPVKKLHSPLLKPDEYEDEEPPIHSTGKKGRPLRSPILGGSEPSYDFEQDEFAGKHKGLRSPLLGGGDVEPPQHRFSGEPSHARPGHLHSPLLDSTYDEYDDFIDDFETVEDPNVLRSPLLAAKVPLHTHTHEPAESSVEPSQVPVQPVQASQPVAQSPVVQPSPPAKTSQPVLPSQPIQPVQSGQPAAQPGQPVQQASYQAPTPSQMSPLPDAKSSMPEINPVPEAPQKKPEPAGRFPTAGVGQLPHPTKVGMSGPSSMKSPLLGSQGDEDYESSRFAPPTPGYQDEGMSSIIRMFVWPLALSACVRLWVMAEYARVGALSPPVIAGELSHIVVITFLILVAINYPTQKRF